MQVNQRKGAKPKKRRRKLINGTKQTVYVKRNFESRSRNHCYSEKRNVLHILSVSM
jgi:hypothetical protein